MGRFQGKQNAIKVVQMIPLLIEYKIHFHRHSIKYHIFKKLTEMHDNQTIYLHKKQQKQKVSLYASS